MSSPAQMVRIIVCGSRSWKDRGLLENELGRLLIDRTVGHQQAGLVIVHGDCPFGGADLMADEWAKEAGKRFRIEVERHPPPQDMPFARACHARNQAMADAGAWLCIGFTNGRNENGTWGTGDMFSRALKAGIPIRGIPERRVP